MTDDERARPDGPRWPSADAPAPRRSPDDLLREAWALRSLLDGADPDDHAARIRLVSAQDQVRLEAARQWREHGWRPITDATFVPRPAPSLLLAPALAGLCAAVLSVLLLDTTRDVGAALTLVAAAPLLADRVTVLREFVRLVAGAGALVLGTYVVTGAMPATLVFLPAASLLAAIAAVGPERPDRG